MPNITCRVTHIKRRRELFLFLFQTLPSMSHLHRHKPDQKDLSISTIFGCKETHARIFACTQTSIHAGTHTHSYCTSKQSLTECSELWQTDPPGSKKEGFQVWPSGLPLIPSISSPLGMGHRSRVSLLFTKTHSQTHTQHKLKLFSDQCGEVTGFLLFCVWTSWLEFGVFHFPAQVQWSQFRKTNTGHPFLTVVE